MLPDELLDDEEEEELDELDEELLELDELDDDELAEDDELLDEEELLDDSVPPPQPEKMPTARRSPMRISL